MPIRFSTTDPWPLLNRANIKPQKTREVESIEMKGEEGAIEFQMLEKNHIVLIKTLRLPVPFWNSHLVVPSHQNADILGVHQGGVYQGDREAVFKHMNPNFRLPVYYLKF